MGMGTVWISRRLKLPKNYIEQVQIDALGFTGWDCNLEFSPIALFYDCEKSKEIYTAKLDAAFGASKGIINISYRVCEVYDKIKRILRDHDYF
jgi:hypothetical protein